MKYHGRRDFMSQQDWSGVLKRVALGIVGGFLFSGRSI